MDDPRSLVSRSVVLGVAADPIAHRGEVTISRDGETAATDSRGSAEKTESADSSNPLPVSGYATVTESAVETEPAADVPKLDDSGRFTFEVVIGTDERARVNNPDSWPWRVHGHAIMQFPDGTRAIGSGTMIGRHHVLTAGHVVYDKKYGGWATSMSFQAARNESSIPYGSIKARQLLSISGWTNDNNSDYDMGMLILETELGEKTGWMGVITGPDSILLRYQVNVSGYPGDKGGLQMWTMADVIKAVESERLFYDIDTMGGQSGSGVWSAWSPYAGEKVCAIHTSGHSSGNGATRISRAKFDRIVDWLAHY